MIARATTSASNIARRAVCAGSHHAEADIPDQEDSEASAEGTLLHTLDAQPDPAQEETLTTEQKEVLQFARKSDEDIFAAVRSSTGITEDETFEEGHEKEMFFRKGLRPLFPGHCDRWRYYPRKKILIIIDKKFGRLEVTPAEANMQLRCYAVMGAALWDCDHILVAINQPRLPYEDRLSIAEYTREQIPSARDQILAIWDACQAEDAPRVADHDACRYCKAKLNCDAYRAKFEWLAVPSQDGKDLFTAKLEHLTDIELDTVWRAVTFGKIVESAAKAEIVRRSNAGGMAMYELADTGNTSTINDPVRAMNLLKTAGLSEPEVTACATFGKEKLAEKLKARRNHPSMAAAKRDLQKILEPVLTVEPKAPSLKRIKNWHPSDAIETPALADNGSDSELFPK